jgi:uncharacterized RDD family membrane protein YckC
MIVVTIFLWVLGLAALLLLAVLSTPTDIYLRMKANPGVKLRVTARFFGGLTPLVNISGPTKKHTKTPAKTSKPKRRMKLRSSAILSAAVRLAQGLLRAVQIRSFKVEGAFGTGDPAETGEIYGALTPLIYGAGALPKLRIEVQPIFDRSHFSGEVTAGLRVTPIALLAPLLIFVWQVFGPSR